MASTSDKESAREQGADDRRLVRCFIDSHDEAAFRELYRAHAAYLYRLALRLTAGRESASQDIVQDTWLRAIPKLPQFRWQSSLRTWLCAVLVNVHREELRRRARDADRAAEARRRLSVVGDAEPNESSDLERVIAELPDGYREVLVLHDIEGYTHREIATLLGIEEGTSKSQLSRARRTLRTKLESNGVSTHAR